MSQVVLVVDDNQEIVQFVSEVFNGAYTILTANDGLQALTIMRNEVVDLVVTDVMMPVMDGFALCKQIKNDVELSHVPVILLTAKDTLQSKIEGLELGADVYIEKPFSPKYLLAQACSLLSNRSKLKEHFAYSPVAGFHSIAHTKVDQQLFERINTFINENLENPDLDVNDLAAALNMSRPTLYRKIKGITDFSPNELINITRLKKAANLLVTRTDCKISDIALQIGFNSQSYFTQSFQKQFGMSPKEYISLNKSKVN